VVHLSWTGRPERNAEWPHTTFYDSLEDFIEQRMIPEHNDRLGHRPGTRPDRPGTKDR
jgi:hypothetical protein